MPFAKVEVATAPETFKYFVSIPPLKVEVPVFRTFKDPSVEVAAKRLVEEAVVAKKLVEVAKVVVASFPVKFCKVVEPWDIKLPKVPSKVVVELPPMKTLPATEN